MSINCWKVGAVSANSTSPAIGVSGRAAPGAVMMNSILGRRARLPAPADAALAAAGRDRRTGANHVNIELVAVKGA
ncbi:hypothetical protein MOKP118_14230 [Mycobacterium avium subsp. hominissuis]